MNLPPHVTPEDAKVIAEIMTECRNVLLSRITDDMDGEQQNRLLIAACCAWIELARTGFTVALGEAGFRQMLESMADQMIGAAAPEDEPPPNTSFH